MTPLEETLRLVREVQGELRHLRHALEPCAFDDCPNPIGSTSLRRKFCAAHVGCYQMPFAYWPAERRAKHAALAVRWQAEHPERAQEIKDKAQARYRATHREEIRRRVQARYRARKGAAS